MIKSDKINSWCPDVEQQALDQIELIADQPFVFRKPVLLPDAHPGMVMPIGGVVACVDVVVPSFVGVDIGCGMCAVKTSLNVSDFDGQKKEDLLHSIQRSIPMGFSHNNEKRASELHETAMVLVNNFFDVC